MSKVLELLRKNLTLHMNLQGLNQKQLAEKAGMPASVISRIMKSESHPQIDTVAALAQALELPPAELLSSPSPAVSPEILSALAALSSDDLEFVKGIILQVRDRATHRRRRDA